MIIYFLLFLLSLSFAFIRKANSLWKILMVINAIFFCCGYMTGSDWRQYETYYNWLNYSGIMGMIFIEPGYVIYSYLFQIIGSPFWPFFIITKLITFYIIIHTLSKYSIGNYRLSVVFFLVIFGIFLFIDNPMRNLIGMTISVFSYKYLIERKFLKYMSIILFATMFHMSAILMLLLYPLYPIKTSNKKLIIYYILFNIFFLIFFRFIILHVISLFSFIPLIERRMTVYFLEGDQLTNSSFLSLGFVFQISVFVLLLWKRKMIESIKYGKLFFYGSICFLFLYRIGSIVDIFYRLQLYYSILYAIGVGFIFSTFKIKSNKIIYNLCLSLYLSLVLYTTITSDYKYIPYTNYIEYINKEEMSFEERSQYNFTNSPYNKSGLIKE